MPMLRGYWAKVMVARRVRVRCTGRYAMVQSPAGRMMTLMLLAASSITASASAQTARLLDRADYESRLRGMWLGELIANWTGLPIENRYYQPPFLTDADWGMALGPGRRLDFVFQDPWLSDDDTDIEYVHMHLLTGRKKARLSSAEIVEGVDAPHQPCHLELEPERRTLMGQGVEPPGTSLGASNILRLLISAQLTIEMFGAVNPGMPERALDVADLPIRTAASGYAAHACQFLCRAVRAGDAGAGRDVRPRETCVDGAAGASLHPELVQGGGRRGLRAHAIPDQRGIRTTGRSRGTRSMTATSCTRHSMGSGTGGGAIRR